MGEERAVSTTAPGQFVIGASGAVRFVTDAGRGMGVELAPGAGSWTAVSDRNAKTAIELADGGSVLDKVRQLPISEYSYKSQDEAIRHIGPMAQDFHPLFGLGESELRFSAMNLAGIALAAIQGLDAESRARVGRDQGRIDALEAENKELARRNAELEQRLARLEAIVFDDAADAEVAR